MTSLGTNLLLVFVWLIAFKTSVGALWIKPATQAQSVNEGNNIGEKILNISVGPPTKSGVLKVQLIDIKDCTKLFKLVPNDTVHCTATSCNFSIVANKVLDRESECNFIPVSIKYGFQEPLSTMKYSLMVSDINDNAPQFENRPYTTSIREDLPVGSKLSGLNIHARDNDDGNNAQITYTLEPAGQNSANINDTMTIDNGNGVITLKKPLDYETRNFYQYLVRASDAGNPPLNTSASVWIQIIDVQDSPPVFVSFSFVTHIKENLTIGTSVMKVSAEDGDRGNPNKIFYEIKENLRFHVIKNPDYCELVPVKVGNGDDSCKRFSINKTNGVVSVKGNLSLTNASLKSTYGVCPITVIATEVNSTSNSTQKVTIFIDDINDHGPVFNSKQYHANVSEAAAIDNPITVDKTIQITDDDQQVENNKFNISLQHMDGSAFTALSVWPKESVARVVVSLLVNDKSQLDYETRDSVNFKIVAQGIRGKYSSSATVNLKILSVNEYRPRFESNYTACVSENMTEGHQVIQVKATDKDRGIYGNITYMLYGSNGVFLIDAHTGNVTVGPEKLDYEQVHSYQLTVEATDGGNKKDTANLFVCINDTNDEKPEFTSSQYEGTMTENENFTITVQAKDKDKPDSPNSEVRYTILSVSQNLMKNFTIDSITGQIQATSIDYEELTSDQIVLVVKASDQGEPQQHSTTNVTITILDANDNSPHFTRQVYKFHVPENASTGFNIGNVSASDADHGINKKLTYLLINETDKFRINSQNGNILILGKLDRETCSRYILQVEVIDGGTPPQSSTTILNITVTDINDESPQLLNSPRIEVAENISVNSSIVKINATDADLNAKLVYSIYKQQIQMDGKGMFVNIPSEKYFGINETTGEIYVNEPLDREVAEIISLGIRVNDINAVGNAQYSQGQQIIKILDVNDNKPKFLRSYIPLSLYENLSVGSTITRVSATDADKNDSVTYRFEANYTQFHINKTTGEITLVKNLDRETNQTITLLVLAEDTKPKRQSSTATISLTILDYNDNSPTFGDGLYNKTYYISEDAPEGYEIVTATATDADTGINADIRYSLVYRDGDQKLPISINHTMGKVFVSGVLDREKTSFYSIGIEAKDMRGQDVNARTGSTWIKINVTDVNDNAPDFISSHYTASVQEDKDVGQSIIQVRATDKDIGENSRLSFTLEGNGSTLFKIDQSSGVIFVNSSLVDLVGQQRFLVVATDHGTPSRNNSANVTVKITDMNNHAPKFPNRTVIYIPEDTCVGTTIFNVSATDQDFSPPNNQVTYILKREKAFKYFNLDETSGRLTLIKMLDKETQEVYELQIIAKDKGKPPLENETTLKINATNVDDEPPEFLIKDYPDFKKSFPVAEGKPKRFVGKVNAYDSDPASKACYKIVDKNDYFEVRSVNGSGEINTLKELDYEKQKVFYFSLETHDCSNAVYNICGGHSHDKDIHDKLSITINITDTNDNPPRFKEKSMHIAIQSDTKMNDVIANLTIFITDKDEYLENKKNFFHIFNFKQHGELSAQEKPFSVDKDVLKTNQLFNAAQMGYIQFSILVNDSIGQNDTAKMKVYIVGKANKVEIMFLQSFEDTQKNKKEFCRKLGNILGHNITIVAGKITSHQSKDGTYEKRKTVMYIYGLKGEVVMPAQELQDLIDLKTKQLSDIQNRYSVISIRSLKQKAATSSTSSKKQVIFLAVIALLGVSLFAILLLFYGSNQRYKRKLKAAKIDVHSNKEDIAKWIVPGSNIHALGESNPIYNKEINPVTTLPEKVSLNSLDMNEVRDSAVFVDQYDEQEIALDFIDDPTNETSTASQYNSKTFLDNVIKEREAEMNKKNQNSGSMSGSTNMALSVTNLETTDV